MFHNWTLYSKVHNTVYCCIWRYIYIYPPAVINLIITLMPEFFLGIALLLSPKFWSFLIEITKFGLNQRVSAYIVKLITITLLNFTFFLGLSTDLIYPNGISCTLPADAQQKMINTIAGLENASMVCPGTLLDGCIALMRILLCRLWCRVWLYWSKATVSITGNKACSWALPCWTDQWHYWIWGSCSSSTYVASVALIQWKFEESEGFNFDHIKSFSCSVT